MSIETPSFENLRRQTEEEVTERLEKESLQRNIQGMDELRRELDQEYKEIEEKEYKAIEDKNEIDKIQQQHDKLSYLTKTYELELKDIEPDKPESTLKPTPKIDKESTQALIAKIDNWREKLDQEYEEIEKKEYKIPEDFEEQKIIEKQHQKLSNLVKELEQELKEEEPELKPRPKPTPESPLPSSRGESKKSEKPSKAFKKSKSKTTGQKEVVGSTKDLGQKEKTKKKQKDIKKEEEKKPEEITTKEEMASLFDKAKSLSPEDLTQLITESVEAYKNPEVQEKYQELIDVIKKIIQQEKKGDQNAMPSKEKKDADTTTQEKEKASEAVKKATEFIKKQGVEKTEAKDSKLGTILGVFASGILLVLILFMLLELKAVDKLVDAGGKVKT